MKATRTGYWVFDVIEPKEHKPGFVEEVDVPDPSEFGYDTKRVYEPVTVEIVDGEAHAYKYRDDMPEDVSGLNRLRESKGKVYVPMEQVRMEKPRSAERYNPEDSA